MNSNLILFVKVNDASSMSTSTYYEIDGEEIYVTAISGNDLTVERGKDPRNHTLMAFGGAGPAHACRIGRILGVPEVVLPYAAGITSAFGFLIAPIPFEFSQSYPIVLDKMDWNKLNKIYEEMEIKGQQQLSDAGVTNKEMIFSRTADMRLLGQFHEIHLPIPNGHLGPEKLVNIETNFVKEYRRLYSHIFEGNPIMALTWRLRVESPKPKINISNNLCFLIVLRHTANSKQRFGSLAILKCM